MSRKNAHVAVFGNVKIKRAYCHECECWSFVIDGIRQCCDTRVDDAHKKPLPFKVIIPPERKRRSPSEVARKIILENQNNRCLYCNRKFGEFYIKNGKVGQLTIEWDHQVPFTYSLNNHKENFVAACNLCNGIKSDKMFSTIKEVTEYVSQRIKKKKIEFIENVPSVQKEVYNESTE